MNKHLILLLLLKLHSFLEIFLSYYLFQKKESILRKPILMQH